MPVKQRLTELLHPAGRTDRRTYRLVVPMLALGLVPLTFAGRAELFPYWAYLALAIPLAIVLILLTIRRLRDSDLVWLLLLGLFPFTLWVELGSFRCGPVQVALIDLGLIVRLTPIAAGLLLPGRTGQSPGPDTR